MKIHRIIPAAFSFIVAIISCNSGPSSSDKATAQSQTPEDSVATITGSNVDLPAPYATESVNNYCKVIGWPDGKTPTAPSGFTVSKFADNLQNPRWVYVANNGDVFVCET